MGNKIKGKCDGLIEGQEYQFRIRAVNKGGPSKPSPPSESMIAKHRFIPPHLKGDGIYDITLKKGRPIRYDLWFGGEPAPTVEWIRNGRTLTSDENTSIELYSKNTIYTERNTVLSIPKVSFFFFFSIVNAKSLLLPAEQIFLHIPYIIKLTVHCFFCGMGGGGRKEHVT